VVAVSQRGLHPSNVPEDLEWHPFDSFTHAENSEELWIQFRLPELGPQEPIFCIWTANRHFSLFLDKEKIFSIEENEPAAEETWIMVPLASDFSGKNITMHNPFPDSAPLYQSAWYLSSLDTFPHLVQQQTARAMHADLPHLVQGILFCCVGLTALFLFLIRREAREPIMLAFSLFLLLWGLRSLSYTVVVRQLFNQTSLFWDYFEAVCIHLLPIPASAQFYFLVEPKEREPFKWIWLVSSLFALIALPLIFITGQPGLMMLYNNLLIICVILAVLVLLHAQKKNRERPVSRVLSFGLVVFFFFTLTENIRALVFPLNTPNMEGLGLLTLVVCVGYVIASRFFNTVGRLGAIENELDVARKIQTSLLPQEMPVLENLTLAARYVPMESVAGDYYDFTTIDKQRLGILVADVSGHGVPAALIASMVKVAFSAQAEQSKHPGRVLSGMNRVLFGQLKRQFVSAIYMVLDLKNAEIIYASAGHPAPLVWRQQDNSFVDLSERGPALGLLGEFDYQSHRVDLINGDRVLLYTDGIVEAHKPSGELFGEDRFREFVRANPTLSAESLAERLLWYLDLWSEKGQSLDDDLTLVVADIALVGGG